MIQNSSVECEPNTGKHTEKYFGTCARLENMVLNGGVRRMYSWVVTIGCGMDLGQPALRPEEENHNFIPVDDIMGDQMTRNVGGSSLSFIFYH